MLSGKRGKNDIAQLGIEYQAMGDLELNGDVFTIENRLPRNSNFGDHEHDDRAVNIKFTAIFPSRYR